MINSHGEALILSQNLFFKFQQNNKSMKHLKTIDNKIIKRLILKHTQWRCYNCNDYLELKCNLLKENIRGESNFIWRIIKHGSFTNIDIPNENINSNNLIIELSLTNNNELIDFKNELYINLIIFYEV